MKKILYITVLLFACISCDEWIDDYNKNFDKVEKERRQKSIEEHSGYGMGAAMVHSPNCECNKGSERLNDEKNCFD